MSEIWIQNFMTDEIPATFEITANDSDSTRPWFITEIMILEE